ncbi:hypothetical protein Hanom_Chr12g01148331 [Helianthus anomalus]
MQLKLGFLQIGLLRVIGDQDHQLVLGLVLFFVWWRLGYVVNKGVRKKAENDQSSGGIVGILSGFCEKFGNRWCFLVCGVGERSLCYASFPLNVIIDYQ